MNQANDQQRFARYPSLDGRAVLVTGGANGIGASIVEHFVAQGARVAFLDHDAEKAELLERRLRGSAVALAHRVCDLGDVVGTRAAIDALSDLTGSFQVVVNNAADDTRHCVLEVTPEQWDRSTAVNVRAQFFVAQYAIRKLPPDRPASIINLGSTAWMKGATDVIAYATAKAGILGLSKSLAREFGKRGVRVNCIAPGWIMTERQREHLTAAGRTVESVVAMQCLPEPLEPADVARLALWLAADDSRHCSGQMFVVDGGVA